MKKPKRRFGIWLLSFLFGLIGLSGTARFWLTVQNGTFYQSLGLEVSTGYLLVGGLLWALVGFCAAAMLFFRRSFVRLVVWVGAAVLTATYWFDRLVMTANPDRAANWAFALGLNGLAGLLIFWVFSRKKNRAYFEWSKTE